MQVTKILNNIYTINKPGSMTRKMMSTENDLNQRDII